MALDAEQELKNVWWEWIIHAKSCHDESDGSAAWTESFFADSRNAAEGRNSIMDAEALICLLLPQGALPSFNLRGGFESRGPVLILLMQSMDVSLIVNSRPRLLI